MSDTAMVDEIERRVRARQGLEYARYTEAREAGAFDVEQIHWARYSAVSGDLADIAAVRSQANVHAPQASSDVPRNDEGRESALAPADALYDAVRGFFLDLGHGERPHSGLAAWGQLWDALEHYERETRDPFDGFAFDPARLQEVRPVAQIVGVLTMQNLPLDDLTAHIVAAIHERYARPFREARRDGNGDGGES